MRKTVGVATLALIASANIAVADDHGMGGNFYAGISAGYSILDDVDFKSSKSGATSKTADFDGSFVGLMRGGYDYGSIRAELELGYRNFDIDSVSNATNESGDVNLYSIMLNGAYDFDTGTDFTPYVSLGIGAAIAEGTVSYTGSDGGTPNESKDFYGIAPAGQIGIGTAYSISQTVDLTGGYSLLAAPTDETGEDDVILLHALTIGLNYKF